MHCGPVTEVLLNCMILILLHSEYAYKFKLALCKCVHFVHAFSLLTSLATTCDLEKGALRMLMWQLMPFPPTQMALIGYGTAQGQLLGVTVTKQGREVERRDNLMFSLLFLCASALTNTCLLASFIFLSLCLARHCEATQSTKGNMQSVKSKSSFKAMPGLACMQHNTERGDVKSREKVKVKEVIT